MEPLVTQINENLVNDKVDRTYPYVLVKGEGDPLMITVESLEKGDLPLLIDYQGVTYNIGSIRKSALVLAQLLTVFKFTIVLSSTQSYDINTKEDILEVGVW